MTRIPTLKDAQIHGTKPGSEVDQIQSFITNANCFSIHCLGETAMYFYAYLIKRLDEPKRRGPLVALAETTMESIHG